VPDVSPQSPGNITIEFSVHCVFVEQIPYTWRLQCQIYSTFSVVDPVAGRQERSSLSTDIHPFFKS
jgi:hypothetical protein